MVMAKLTVDKVPAKTLRHLDKATRTRVVNALKKLAEDPRRDDLDVGYYKADKAYRLRVGNWRILFERSEEEVRVRAIRPRGGAYKK